MLFNNNRTYIGVIVTTTLLIISQLLHSQSLDINKGKVNIGLESGIQFTGVDDPYSQISDGGVGYNIGPFFEYYISNQFKIRAGLQFDNRAFKLKSFGIFYGDSIDHQYNSIFNEAVKYKSNYLTIPLSLIYIKGSDKLKFHLQGTLYYSLFINSVQTGGIDVVISDNDAGYFNIPDYPELSVPGSYHYNHIDNAFNSSDIGINLFFGCTYYINSKIGISLSPGFTYSFSNVWEDPQRATNWSRIYKVTGGLIYIIK